jgi:hypothetical protein
VLVDKALAYNRDFVAPTLKRRKPDANEGAACWRSMPNWRRLGDDASAEDLQNIVYEIGKNPTSASRTCATGSRRFTKRCSAPARGRAWAASSRCTASRTRAN